ncbi:MAG TPA: AraD1 family protein [Terriglobales bacterium]|nr:AraD1 family protein [Terriglobales bacterium]
MSARLIQLKREAVRRVALVEEPKLRLLDPEVSSIYDLVRASIAEKMDLSRSAMKRATKEQLDYDPIYLGNSDWKIMPAIDHPEPSRCSVSGTGLTHLGSARDRQAMHATPPAAAELEQLTDSMKMFRSGLAGGRPEPGYIGTSPEWFYKGTGSGLRAHGEALFVPSYAEDGGEEAEIAGIYFNDQQGQPRRIGMTIGNEFSDHCFEKTNYLNLASSKLRTCSIGPELVIEPAFHSVEGEVTIERAGRPLWRKSLRTGEAEMCHSLQNIEHHHFKHEAHRQPGDIHVHFFGADCLSFGEGVRLADGDFMQIAFEGFGRPLRNRVSSNKNDPTLISVVSMR